MMKYVLRAAASVMTALLVIMMSVPAAALSVKPKIITGEFRYFSSQLSEVRTHTYYYCDDYFSGSGKDVNEHLRTMSLALSLTAFGTSQCEDNVVSILKNIGFDKTDISVLDMSGEPTEDSLGTAIAHKKTAYGDVIAAVVRGIDYHLEWKNNMDIGKSGPAAGLMRAAQTLTDRIAEYEELHSLKGAKIWVVGYSRGGAVVDLAGRCINENLSKFGITEDDLYDYTFEAPAGNDLKTGYANVHNVYNASDVLTMTFPVQWGFCHAGTDEPIMYDNMKLKRVKLNYLGNIGLVETGKYSSAAVIARDFIDLLANSVSRSSFADNSDNFGNLIQALMSMSIDELETFAGFLLDAVSTVPDRFSVMSMIKLLSEDEGSAGYERDVDRLCGIIEEELDLRDHSRLFSDEEYKKIKVALIETFRMLIPAIKADFSLDAPFEKICTFFYNIGDIVYHHFSDTVLYPVEAQDSFYKPEPISGAVITVDEKSAEVISVRVGLRVLAPGLDYTLKYKDADGNYTEPDRSGTYTAVVSGMGSYIGTAEKVFTVKFDHHHHWTFKTYGNTVVVMCTEPGCKKYGTNKEYSIRLAVEGKEYDGEPVKAGFDLSENFPSEITICKIDLNYRGTVSEPSAIGQYRAYAELYVTDSPGTRASIFSDYSIRRISVPYDKLTIFAAEDMLSDAEVFYSRSKLTELSDYVISFTDKSGNEIATPSAPGEYNIVWKGRGIYTGTVTKPIVITEGSEKEFSSFPIILAIIISSSVVAVTVTVAVIVCLRQNRIRKNAIYYPPV